MMNSSATTEDEMQGVFHEDSYGVHHYVFSLLALEDLKMASCVCKAWSDAITNRAIWKRVFLRDILFDETSVFGTGKPLDWRELYKFCFKFPHFAKELFKSEIAAGSLRKYGIVGFVWQMGYYEDEDINYAVSQIVWKYLRSVVVEDVNSLLRMKEALQKYCLPCVCLEVLQQFPAEPLVHFETGGACNCLGNAVNALLCPPEFEYLRVSLFSQLIGGNVVIFGSDTAVSDIQPENEVRYVSHSQIFSRYSFVSVHKNLDCTLGYGPSSSTIDSSKRKLVKLHHHLHPTDFVSASPPTLEPTDTPSPPTTSTSPSTSPPAATNYEGLSPLQDQTDILNVDIHPIIEMFHIDHVDEFLRCVIVHKLASRVAQINKEWARDEIAEIRQKLQPFTPAFVLGIREDIFQIKAGVRLRGSAFPTVETLKEAIFELSPIGSIVRPRMIFVKQIEYTDMVKVALPKKYRNTMYCYLQNLAINVEPMIPPGKRGLQELIDINENFEDLSVGFYLKSTLLCSSLDEALNLVVEDKIMQSRRTVIFCVDDGFVIERDGIIKISNAAREVPRCGILFRKRKDHNFT